MSKIKVTLKRVYEIPESMVLEALDNEYKDHKLIFSDEQIKEKAEKIALDWFGEELPYFESTPNDFVSSTIEIIPDNG